MKHNREFWTRHVKAWRSSGQTQREYCRRHRLLKGTLGYWVSTLNRLETSGSALVEVGHTRLSRSFLVGLVEARVNVGGIAGSTRVQPAEWRERR